MHAVDVPIEEDYCNRGPTHSHLLSRANVPKVRNLKEMKWAPEKDMSTSASLDTTLNVDTS